MKKKLAYVWSLALVLSVTGVLVHLYQEVGIALFFAVLTTIVIISSEN